MSGFRSLEVKTLVRPGVPPVASLKSQDSDSFAIWRRLNGKVEGNRTL
jgi:hypothetical protein